MIWQFFVIVGIFCGFTANLIFLVSILWLAASNRFGMSPTLVLLVLILAIPESPRWLLKRSKVGAAFAAMVPLRETRLQAARDVFYANQQIQAEEQYLRGGRAGVNEDGGQGVMQQTGLQRQARSRNSNYFVRLCQLFQHKRTRRAPVASACVMLGQQLCGMCVFKDRGVFD